MGAWCLVLVVVLAGYVGGFASNDADPTPTGEASTPTAEARTPTAGSTGTPTVRETAVVDYGDLSPTQRAAFDEAVDTSKTGVRAGGHRVFVERVDPPENGTVVDLEERSGPAGDLLGEAIESGGSESSTRHVMRGYTSGDVVEYQGDYYRIDRIYIVDYGGIEMTAERAERDC
ncbi:hypothetical protein BRD00_06105 [Halobacteriales archaeon QS_8_69_26]|nr:MAG: hypothetical protein BRD00_06105 [Halobacteriales archaeon QS_8_69_26]